MDRQRRTRQAGSSQSASSSDQTTASSDQTTASSDHLQIRYRDIGELIPYAMNSRTHSEAQVAQIAGSIRQFGWTNPVLLDGDSGIIAGHGRVMAARMLGLRQIPTIELRHLSETQRRAYVIADNQLALLAGWDENVLALEMKALELEDFDLGLTGFDQAEIDRLLDGAGLGAEGGSGEGDPDEVPEAPADPITKPGDLWLLGDHRLLCGDSTKPEDVERLMARAKANLCFTSPPYGQQRDYTEEGKAKVADWDGLMRGVFGNLPMADAGQVLVNLGMIHRDGEWIPYWDAWIEWMREQGWRRFGWYVWDQGWGLPGDWNGRLAPSHEFVFHFNKEPVRPEKIIESKMAGQTTEGKKGLRGKDGKVGAFSHASGSNSEYTYPDSKIPDSVIRINRQCGGVGHPAPFSVGFALFGMKCWSGIVYEPFCGSGTTLIAAEQLGRKCYGMEISPAYCDVIVKRWQAFTGKAATLDATGQTFDEIAGLSVSAEHDD